MNNVEISKYFKLDRDGNIDLGSNKPFLRELMALPAKHSLYENNTPLDLYSYKFYESENYWWCLMLYNDLLDPDDTGVLKVKGPGQGDLDRLLAKYSGK